MKNMINHIQKTKCRKLRLLNKITYEQNDNGAKKLKNYTKEMKSRK